MMKTIEDAIVKCSREFYGVPCDEGYIPDSIFSYGFKAGVEFAQKWIPFPSKEIPELNTDYLVKCNFLGVEEIDIMTFRNTKEIGQVFTKNIETDGIGGIQIKPVTHWRPIELK